MNSQDTNRSACSQHLGTALRLTISARATLHQMHGTLQQENGKFTTGYSHCAATSSALATSTPFRASDGRSFLSNNRFELRLLVVRNAHMTAKKPAKRPILAAIFLLLFVS